MASFTTETGALPLTPRGPGDILDLGGSNISSSTLMMALPPKSNAPALSYAAQVSGRTVDADRTAMAFVSHRFVDAPADDSSALAIGHAEAVYVCQVVGGRVDFIRIARGGDTAERLRRRQPATSPPAWLLGVSASLPPRDTIPPARPGEVVGLTSGERYGSTPLEFVGQEREEPDRKMHGLKGVVLQDAQLVHSDVDVALRPEIVARPSDRPGFMTSRQGLDSRDEGEITVITKPYTPPTQAPGPQNMRYGDPLWGCGYRTTTDSCHDCCDTKNGTAVNIGMGVGTALGGAAVLGLAAKGALSGVWAGPLGLALGGLVGCLVGLAVAWAATSGCDAACEQLRPYGDLGQRQYRLTAVIQDDDGDTAGYRGVDSEGSEWILSREEAVAAIAGGLRIQVVDAVGPASVRARSRLGSAYLASVRDTRLTDNIGELPSEEGLPDVTSRGIALT